MTTQPNTYIPGQVVVLTDVITDPATNLPVDDPSVAIDLYRPDSTLVSPALTPSHPSTGTYTAQVTPATGESGTWEYVFRATGPGAGAARGWFYVSPVP